MTHPLNASHTVLLGVDFGTKRIGIAVGQTVTQTARPLTTLNAKEGEPDWNELDKLVKTWRPDAFVVGIPLHMDGTEQSITFHARTFCNALKERYDLPVYEMDERLTTVSARETLFEKGGYKAIQRGQVDSIAAQFILENWLAHHKEENK